MRQKTPPSPPPAPTPEPSEFLTPQQAAKVLHLSPRTLEGMRYRGDGPAFAKLGDGRSARILYPRDLLDQWVASRVRLSTCRGEAPRDRAQHATTKAIVLLSEEGTS